MSSFAPSDAQRAVFDSARLDLLDFSRPSTINQERERQEITRNFCSDTMTAPTPQMLEYALKAASLGDDVMGWDYCAPVGSMLVGPSDIIALVRRYRKLFGGAMRQIGFLSAAAAYSLSHHLPLLPGVHQKAKRLAAGMESLGIRITVPVETCMVFFDPSPIGLTTEEIAAKGEALDKPIKMFGGDRLAVHIQTSDEAIDDLLALISSMAKGSQGALSKKASLKTPYPAKL
ncbi:hypothetical protein M408DRAFT_20093 [Serendipita vermifera MAFF 305830]|uniref:Aromatic amino acid beta-eliminating lyase/threonine aldolase domain-containing protein n=1 Tax=Serendipita vermifera MAFF 305830 TaxID=933852 RepID=A0A0C3B7D6_SERVB|nr:hypothetical protein M408DRAFT_20093 [Serendipita vermifera MAFF 305830]